MYSAGHGNLPVKLLCPQIELTDEAVVVNEYEIKTQEIEDSIYNFNAILDAVGDEE